MVNPEAIRIVVAEKSAEFLDGRSSYLGLPVIPPSETVRSKFSVNRGR